MTASPDVSKAGGRGPVRRIGIGPGIERDRVTSGRRAPTPFPTMPTPPFVSPGRHRWYGAALLGVVAMFGLVAAPASASAATAGTATIIQPDSLTPLDSGGSATPYGVALPPGASCPGDTAHQGYRVDSYLVPKGQTPTEVNFKKGVPSRWFGYIAEGSYYGAVNTAENTGQVMALPEFTWTRLSSYLGDLFPRGATRATWEGGIVCVTTNGAVTNYWNSQIVFTRSATDPGGFTWRVVANPPLTANRTWLTAGIVLLVLAALFGAVAIGLSRRRDSDGDTKDPGPTSDPTPPDGEPSDRVHAGAGRERR